MFTGYVDASKLFTRAYRLLSGIAGGSGGVRAYEEARRVTAIVDSRRLSDLLGLCREYFASCIVEVKASCKLRDTAGLVKLLKDKGFAISKTSNALLAYGVVEGRMVEIEVLRGSVKIKVGSRTRASRIKPPVPSSLFTVPLDEASQALAHLEGVIGLIEGVLYA